MRQKFNDIRWRGSWSSALWGLGLRLGSQPLVVDPVVMGGAVGKTWVVSVDADWRGQNTAFASPGERPAGLVWGKTAAK